MGPRTSNASTGTRLGLESRWDDSRSGKPLGLGLRAKLGSGGEELK